MADTHDPSQDLRTRDGETAAAGAPRPSRTGSVSKLGFDDPTLRPLPPEQLEYHAPHTDAHPERHEHSDVPIRPLAISLAAIAFILAGSFVFLYFLFFHYKGQQDALEVKRTNVPDAKPLIEGPRLQGVPGFSDKHPKDELKDQRDAYRAELAFRVSEKASGADRARGRHQRVAVADLRRPTRRSDRSARQSRNADAFALPGGRIV